MSMVSIEIYGHSETTLSEEQESDIENRCRELMDSLIHNYDRENATKILKETK